MTLPRLHGIGDSLLQAAPGIAAGLRKIIRPEADLEDAFKAMLAKNPNAIDDLITLDRANPGIIAKMYGKKAQEVIAGKQLTPATVNRQTRDEDDTTVSGQRVEINSQNIRQNELEIADREDEIKRRKEVDNIIGQYQKEDPEGAKELARHHAVKQRFGVSPEDIEVLKGKTEELRTRKGNEDKALKFIKGKTAAQIYEALNGRVDPKTGEVSEPTADIDTIGAIRSSSAAEGYRSYEKIRMEREAQDAAFRKQQAMDLARDARTSKAEQSRIDHYDEEVRRKTKESAKRQINVADNQVNSGINNINKILIKGENEGELTQPVITQINEALRNRSQYQMELNDNGEVVLPNVAELVKEDSGLFGLGHGKYRLAFKDAEGNEVNGPFGKASKKIKKKKADTTSVDTSSKSSIDTTTSNKKKSTPKIEAEREQVLKIIDDIQARNDPNAEDKINRLRALFKKNTGEDLTPEDQDEADNE